MVRIGDILRDLVPLSGHDVEEILHEQKATRQSFGEAAMALGKARPDQVWAAWLRQLETAVIDPARHPADAHAAAVFPAALARAFGLVPLRVRGNEVVVAAAEPPNDSAVRQIERQCKAKIVFARSTPPAVRTALDALYPATVSVA